MSLIALFASYAGDDGKRVREEDLEPAIGHRTETMEACNLEAETPAQRRRLEEPAKPRKPAKSSEAGKTEKSGEAGKTGEAGKKKKSKTGSGGGLKRMIVLTPGIDVAALQFQIPRDRRLWITGDIELPGRRYSRTYYSPEFLSWVDQMAAAVSGRFVERMYRVHQPLHVAYKHHREAFPSLVLPP